MPECELWEMVLGTGISPMLLFPTEIHFNRVHLNSLFSSLNDNCEGHVTLLCPTRYEGTVLSLSLTEFAQGYTDSYLVHEYSI